MLKPNLVLEASNSFLTKYEQYGTPNISLESIGNTLYSDATSDGVSRGDTLYVWDEIIQNYTKDNGKVMLTNPNAFAFPYINTVLSAPDPITYAQIADEAIPFYQIALRGYVPYSSEPINLASDSKECMLRAVETGSGLTYSFVMRDPSGLKETNLNYLYSCDYDMWKDEMLEQYKQYSGVMKKIGSQQIKNHEKLAEDVYRTTYENDVAVIVNYSDTDYQVDGSTVAAGSYLALGGE